MQELGIEFPGFSQALPVQSADAKRRTEVLRVAVAPLQLFRLGILPDQDFISTKYMQSVDITNASTSLMLPSMATSNGTGCAGISDAKITADHQAGSARFCESLTW